jgi:hypothetical protein
MVALPKWLLSLVMDKMMPSSLAAMISSAVAYEKRQEGRSGRSQEGHSGRSQEERS